jgi:hypothetical protein
MSGEKNDSAVLAVPGCGGSGDLVGSVGRMVESSRAKRFEALQDSRTIDWDRA